MAQERGNANPYKVKELDNKPKKTAIIAIKDILRTYELEPTCDLFLVTDKLEKFYKVSELRKMEIFYTHEVINVLKYIEEEGK